MKIPEKKKIFQTLYTVQRVQIRGAKFRPTNCSGKIIFHQRTSFGSNHCTRKSIRGWEQIRELKLSPRLIIIYQRLSLNNFHFLSTDKKKSNFLEIRIFSYVCTLTREQEKVKRNEGEGREAESKVCVEIRRDEKNQETEREREREKVTQNFLFLPDGEFFVALEGSRSLEREGEEEERESVPHRREIDEQILKA